MRPLLASLLLVGACSTPAATPVDASVDVANDAATAVCTERAGAFAPLSTRCGHFVDEAGRVVVLTGVNARIDGVFDVALDMGRAPLESIPAFTIEDARAMRAMGFNTLRLPIQWSGVEPTETGGFDAAYLDRVAAVVALCREAGLYVLIDWHQTPTRKRSAKMERRAGPSCPRRSGCSRARSPTSP